ncbi:MAG: hypothetical protein JO002_12790, partial [Burkholderiaceae bacterium]|nr:hypothetical protein [Burkholderiaceae bacterium]
AAGVAILFGVAVAIAPHPARPAAVAATTVDQFAQVQTIINERCVACHSDHPTQPGFAAAPVGIMLQTPALVHQNAAKVYQQAVQLKAMPLGNLTHITDEERAEIGAWYEAGAK